MKVLSNQKSQESGDDAIKIDDEKVERDKKLFMWTGISCLMVIFFAIWIFSLQYEFKASVEQGAKSEFNWSQAKVELDKAMAQMKQGLEQIKKIQANPSQTASSSQPKLTAEQLDLLKDKLLNEIATGTASGTKK